VSEKKILISGLPGSGKTTFFAALWHLLSEHEVPIALSLSKLPENREYLNKLSAKWRVHTEVDRTPTDELREIHLALKNDRGEELELYAPDVSGETWKGLWTDRSCTTKIAEWSKEACGVMLFLHADNIDAPVDVPTYISMAGGTPQDSGVTTGWDPTDAPTQVILVDILQSLSRLPLCNNARNLVVVISAWDKAAEMGQTPEQFIEFNLPLLYQYLRCSGDFTQFNIFGVSALGGDPKLPADSERMKAENIPAKRIQVVNSSIELPSKHDLTLPIQWLLEAQVSDEGLEC